MVVIATLEEEEDDAVRARISATGGDVKAERERAFLLARWCPVRPAFRALVQSRPSRLPGALASACGRASRKEVKLTALIA